MDRTHDPTRYSYQLQRELDKLADLADDRDENAILDWGLSLDKADSTRTHQIRFVRTFARRAHLDTDAPAVVEMEKPDYQKLLRKLESGTAFLERNEPDNPLSDDPYLPDDGLGDGTLRQVRQNMRLFFRDGLDRDWATEIRVGAPKKSKVKKEDLLTSDEVESMLEATVNARDKALIAFLLATGQRLSATLSIRVGDVQFPDGLDGEVHLNEEAIGLKGAEGFRPLDWSAPYVQNWLDYHPHNDDKDAALWCAIQHESNGDTEPTDPITPEHVGRQLRSIRDRTGIEKRVNPHSFRHSAITQFMKEGRSEQLIKWMVGWDEDSGQFKRYGHVDNQEMADAWRRDSGIEVERDETTARPDFDKCPNAQCGAPLSDWHNPVACPACGLTLSSVAREAKGEAEDALTQEYRDADPTDETEILEATDTAVEVVDDLGPDALAKLADAVAKRLENDSDG